MFAYFFSKCSQNRFQTIMADCISEFWLLMMVGDVYKLHIHEKRDPTICVKCLYFDVNAE